MRREMTEKKNGLHCKNEETRPHEHKLRRDLSQNLNFLKLQIYLAQILKNVHVPIDKIYTCTCKC
jgi:hypothetical protein